MFERTWVALQLDKDADSTISWHSAAVLGTGIAELHPKHPCYFSPATKHQ